MLYLLCPTNSLCLGERQHPSGLLSWSQFIREDWSKDTHDTVSKIRRCWCLPTYNLKQLWFWLLLCNCHYQKKECKQNSILCIKSTFSSKEPIQQFREKQQYGKTQFILQFLQQLFIIQNLFIKNMFISCYLSKVIIPVYLLFSKDFVQHIDYDLKQTRVNVQLSIPQQVTNALLFMLHRVQEQGESPFQFSRTHICFDTLQHSLS